MSLKLAHMYEEIARFCRDGTGGVVATVVAVGGSTPRDAGAKMIVYADGRTLGSVGGGAIESETIERARALLGGSEPVLLSFDLGNDVGMTCGGRMDIFLEPIARGPSALVVGGGHVGQAVAGVAKRAGFRVTVVDDRAEIVSEERFPFADRRLVGGTELLRSEIEVDGSTFVVVVTRGHRLDQEREKELLVSRPKYIGMIGSLEKVRASFDALEAQGVSRSELDWIHAPIGLDIGAQTPEEIGVAVVAEMIAVRRGIADTAMLRDKAEYKGRDRP